ncbi:hypothetical protein D0U02_19305 [Burkholderia pseudomallei]|nr:hypothetical protein F5D26_12830 [Burkholderia pseudomallei]PNX11988.1 hypothetical protein CF650_27810 [Burkholderia sp. 129]MPT63674.1 hypothetical protein [Burkholderia pseudomallei]MPT72856.1 hypothetical protein [Burkholderia pseudomallei]MPT78190.1 hypothetical protein [Burkholderia pseudomallei]
MDGVGDASRWKRNTRRHAHLPAAQTYDEPTNRRTDEPTNRRTRAPLRARLRD